ncbi:glycoside hydrolase family 130 protein [Paraflavitalea pollutisoli]|uniref:glycoside hydrolase family 130 protein n=1 Tax=Paraflavitalea pollutisoli TaxID=3034143 RepID=UPI0023EDAEC4|nr:glycoside hydrolase family 130 protein [Paraflavitalea sp. H1-2-19X]
MKLQVNRLNIRLKPDVKKVIPRFFNTGDERAGLLIHRVLQLPDIQASALLQQVRDEFGNKYHDLVAIFEKHGREVAHLVPIGDEPKISVDKRLLIGAYFTMEYSLEHAALFNPSIVVAPDQSNTATNELNVILSFRATGEGHISSLVFKAAKLDNNARIHFAPTSQYLYEGAVTLHETGYELQFPPASTLSERIIFPVVPTEKNGIEDARFTRFTHDDGTVTYIGTYTAYDGSTIRPHLVETTDFIRFRMTQLSGKVAINKNLALFPRKVNGQYAMIGRIDGFNNYIMYSEDLYHWDTAAVLQTPQYPWEYVQIGNAGPPIETDKGWLVITHGVGPMRKYCLGASLFDLQDPSIELGRLQEPLLMPEEDERHGYVPNVVYSCGALVHRDQLFIPYAVSDYATSFATVVLQELLNDILRVQ